MHEDQRPRPIYPLIAPPSGIDGLGGDTLTPRCHLRVDVTDRPIPLSTCSDLEALVDDHDRVLVEFHTNGCSLCQAIQPVLSGVAQTSDVVVGTMNPRDDPQLVDEYDVRSVPKLLLFEDGELVGTREEGFLGVAEVREFVEPQEASGCAD